MKPAAFDYKAPRSIEEALEIKAQGGDEAKLLAGGQSLIPAMNFRVAQPALLIDLNKLDELRFIKEDKGELKIGTMTTQATVEKSNAVKNANPLIHETMPFIAHPQIRNRGTFGGSLAHADPASELPVVATALGAKFKAQNTSGERWIEAKDFFLGFLTVSLEDDEMLTEISFPKFSKKTGWSFMEIARRHGDYAMAGVAALITINGGGTCKNARLVYLNVGDGPVDAVEASEILAGNKITEASIEAAAEKAAEDEIMPYGNVHASADYQKHLVKILTKRALTTAFERAKGKSK